MRIPFWIQMALVVIFVFGLLGIVAAATAMQSRDWDDACRSVGGVPTDTYRDKVCVDEDGRPVDVP